MNITFGNFDFVRLYIILIFLGCSFDSIAQTRKLVWADEFNQTEIDRSIWKFGSGLTNDNIHYYTDRTENAQIVNGNLQIIALKESYQGYNYTSALLETKNSVNWRHGRIEARIKLPATNGFVPAFWMLPFDDRYGWWPLSGEIDIMEHPTNQVDKIYGTVHTGAYNSFTGSDSMGGIIQIPDAETTFHIYAIEWTEDQIDFYVDNQKYFTFSNDHASFETWPFEQPFYIILNLAVGGAWVGSPDTSSVFPAIMEVDYVRVYQYMNDAAINGDDYVLYNSQTISYAVPDIDGASYVWSVPDNAQIVSGKNTHQVDVEYGIFGGDVSTVMTTSEGSYEKGFPVKVSSNYLKNAGFEKGVKYWYKSISYPCEADFLLTTADVHSGQYSLFVDVTKPGTNAWDISLSNKDIMLETGKEYNISFWAKTEGVENTINAAIINSSDFSLYTIKTINLTDSWAQYFLNFTAPSAETASFNIDLGDHIGSYYFDDFVFTTPELSKMNLVKNADFSDGIEPWLINTFWPAQAIGTVVKGECAIAIDSGGIYSWDIHLGQTGFSIENGKEYIVSFDAYASDPRQISAFIGKNSDPWTIYSGSNIFSLTATKQTFSYSFNMEEPSDSQSRLGFDIGASLIDVFFDNVSLSEYKTPTNLNNNFNSVSRSFKLYQNYPNPLYLATIIKYNLDKSAYVSLKIFNLVGKEIVTLVDGFQITGEHQINWAPEGLPNGIYFSRLQVDGFCEIKKIILQK
jgi:beta-glucanase (GH16 family)